MPPPTQFNGTFYGDYAGVVAANDRAPYLVGHPAGRPVPVPRHRNDQGTRRGLCTATENTGLTANDENSYMARMSVPTK